VFASILGFVLQDNPGLQRELLNSTLDRMPVIGPQVSGNIGTLTGSGVALAVGVLGALWTGLGVTTAIGAALDRAWAVPRVRQIGFVSSRLRGPLDVIVSFHLHRAELTRRFPSLRRALDYDGGLWIAWPKRSAGVRTDLTEGIVRELGLEAGLVDNKVCAIDETWSGLRFSRRKPK